MEDSHLSLVDLNRSGDDDSNRGPMMSLFGVFDGHGGKEVAKFVRIKYPEILVTLKSFAEGKYEDALRESFHKIDELLEDKQYDKLLKELRALPNPSDQRRNPVNRGDALTVTTTVPTAKFPTLTDDCGLIEKTAVHPEISAGSNISSSSSSSTSSDSSSNDSNSVDSSTVDTNGKSSITTAEAVQLIRNILQNAAKGKQSGPEEADSTTPPLPTPPTSPGARVLGGREAGELSSDSPDSDEDDKVVASVCRDGGEYRASLDTANGKQCNLKDHRVMAGCTAIVAFLVGNKLVVANAGDSRGVLCRKGGVAFQLSYDHKPQQERENQRILTSGGFVNQAGRINGNLNLSRSLGDLKYKQNPHISPEAQMISAEPDIIVTTLCEGDRFFLLACDGIWDCLTCQEASDFVSDKLDVGMSVEEISAEMCRRCLADDPRHSAGVGGDNMTCLVVLLQDSDAVMPTTPTPGTAV